MVATTTREITFTDGNGNTRSLPPGTPVYVGPERRDDVVRIRVCGSLLSQDVRPSAFAVAK